MLNLFSIDLYRYIKIHVESMQLSSPPKHYFSPATHFHDTTKVLLQNHIPHMHGTSVFLVIKYFTMVYEDSYKHSCLSVLLIVNGGQVQCRRNEMLAWWPNLKLQLILLKIFINNIPHSEFHKFMEIFWFIHHYITCFTYVASALERNQTIKYHCT